MNVFYSIPYSFLRQDVAIAQTTFDGVAGLKILANHQLRLHYTYKVWYRGVDKGLIEYSKTYK